MGLRCLPSKKFGSGAVGRGLVCIREGESREAGVVLGSMSCRWKSLVLNDAWLANDTAPVWSLTVQPGSPASNTLLHLAVLWPVSMAAYLGFMAITQSQE